MIQFQQSKHKIDTVFVVALFTLFAFTAFVLVLIGARQYQYTADSMNQNYQVRTATSYLLEKAHQYDTSAGFDVIEFEGTLALALRETISDTEYITYIYLYEGTLYELMVREDSVFSPGTGQAIIELNSFTPVVLKDNLIEITMTGENDEVFTVYLTTKSMRKEDFS